MSSAGVGLGEMARVTRCEELSLLLDMKQLKGLAAILGGSASVCPRALFEAVFIYLIIVIVIEVLYILFCTLYTVYLFSHLGRGEQKRRTRFRRPACLSTQAICRHGCGTTHFSNGSQHLLSTGSLEYTTIF